MMNPLTKNEMIAIISVVLVVIALSLLNFQTSYRRARDNQRKNDLGAMQSALDRYQLDFRSFPLSTPDGRILACAPAEIVNEVARFSPCEWGKDSISDVFDPTYPPYISPLPNDPENGKGMKYVYISNGERYQIYASLEGEDEPEYNPQVLARGLRCGERICNYGRSYSNTPLEKSLEEYQYEIDAQRKKK